MRFPPAGTPALVRRRATALIESAAVLPDLLRAHALLVKTAPFLRDGFLLAKLLRKCSSFPSPHSLAHARSLFDRIPAPDAFLWNNMIRAHIRSHDPNESLRLFRRMSLSVHRTVPDSFSLSLALQACGRCRAPTTGTAVHATVFKLGFCRDLFVQTALLEMYAKVGEVGTAGRVFEEMPERDLVAYNVMLAEYVACGDVAAARRLFDGMSERDLVSWNTMIHGYASSGDLGAARKMFDRTRERDLISWSSMISAYARSRDSSEALRLFREMQLAGLVPDNVTMVSVLSACGDMGALGMGKVIHRFIERNGIKLDLKLGTSLVDMYSKCGDIENSLTVFRDMSERDVLTWSAMIIGLANHGRGKVALGFFSDMLSEGVKPNDITFVGVLTACNHVGLLVEGRAHFHSMSNVYGVNPKVEHYGCMVDLLGKAGLIQEARELIREMPFEPDAVVWRAFLGACRIHKNVELAEEAILKLIELEPHVDGHYVLLSNIYAQANKWDEVANVRKMMRGKSIQKVPGSSLIEIDNRVHEFVAGDKSHPMCDNIYSMLVEMINRLKQAGYMPMISLVLQDIDENAKENALAQHSEKLAIAFGLLTSGPLSTIRIIKNLRVCEDCHSAMKLISLVYNRQLIVRDRNRFHHFAKGECSCRDYW